MNIVRSLIFGSVLALSAGFTNAEVMPPDPFPFPPMPMPMEPGVVYSDIDIVYGFDAHVDSFYIHDAGMYNATLVDFEFPNSFDYIGMMITKGTTESMGVVEGSGSFMFNADPGLYNLIFVGSVGFDDMPMDPMMDHSPMLFNPVSGIGSYGIEVALVPELETWLMFGLGIGGMAWWFRRQQNRVIGDSGLQLAV